MTKERMEDTEMTGYGGAGCKGCTEDVHVKAEDIERMWSRMMAKVDPKQLVDDEIYRHRLALCESCPALQYKTTCRYCGCLVQMKAKLADAKCPFPLSSKW